MAMQNKSDKTILQMCITKMKEYKDKTRLELMIEDYAAMKKGGLPQGVAKIVIAAFANKALSKASVD